MCFIGFGCKTKVAHCCMLFASWLHMLVIVLCRSIWISEPPCRPANPHNFPRGLAFFLALSLLPLRVIILSIYDNLSHFFPPLSVIATCFRQCAAFSPMYCCASVRERRKNIQTHFWDGPERKESLFVKWSFTKRGCKMNKWSLR